MKSKHTFLTTTLGAVLLLLAVSAYGQIHKYYSPGSVWAVTTGKAETGTPELLGASTIYGCSSGFVTDYSIKKRTQKVGFPQPCQWA